MLISRRNLCMISWLKTDQFVVVLAFWITAFLPASGAFGAPQDVFPEKALDEQLVALQNNNEPARNAGIRQAWEFSHPANRRHVGSLRRFEWLLNTPAYRPLLNHISHEVVRVSEKDEDVLFEVTIVAQDARVMRYMWILSYVENELSEGSWATLRVTPPIYAGQSI